MANESSHGVQQCTPFSFLMVYPNLSVISFILFISYILFVSFIVNLCILDETIDYKSANDAGTCATCACMAMRMMS